MLAAIQWAVWIKFACPPVDNEARIVHYLARSSGEWRVYAVIVDEAELGQLAGLIAVDLAT